MFNFIESSKLLTITHLALFLTISAFALPEEVSAKSKEDNSNANEGLPVRRVSGGTRGPCFQAQTPDTTSRICLPLIALMPEGPVLTSTQTPTLLFYIPTISNPQKVQVEFVLRDHQDQLVYETTFPVSGQGGIVSFKIPTTESFKGLESNQYYHWYLSIIYDPLKRDQDQLVEGWLSYRPLEPALASQLAQATPLEKVQLYQKHNLWHEAFYTLAQLKQNHPEDGVISEKWRELLESITLDMIASEPLLKSTTFPFYSLTYNSSPLMSSPQFYSALKF